MKVIQLKVKKALESRIKDTYTSVIVLNKDGSKIQPSQ